MPPETRYAESDGASIAYQVAGEGNIDVLFLPGWISQIEQLWEAPANCAASSSDSAPSPG